MKNAVTKEQLEKLVEDLNDPEKQEKILNMKPTMGIGRKLAKVGEVGISVVFVAGLAVPVFTFAFGICWFAAAWTIQGMIEILPWPNWLGV